MDSIPFIHENRLFQLFFEDDLEFRVARGILDELIKLDAFNPQSQDLNESYHMSSHGVSFEVWVSEMNVIIRKERSSI
jgi:predicted transcriptional regulator